MNCYYCDEDHQIGLFDDVSPAVGICHSCYVGVCAGHAVREEKPGAPLYCVECFRLIHAQTPELALASLS